MLLRDWERTIDEVDKGECIYALEEKRVKGNEKKIRGGKKEKVGVCKRKEKRNGNVNKMLSKTLWDCYLQTTIKSITQVSATEITRNWWNKTGIQLNIRK